MLMNKIKKNTKRPELNLDYETRITQWKVNQNKL